MGMQGQEIEEKAKSAAVPVMGGKRTLGPRAKVVAAGVKDGTPAHGIVEAVRAAVLKATDFSWLAKGDTVFVKTSNNSPNAYPATTSPIAVVAVVGLLREKGAGRVIVGDMSGVQYVRFSPEKTTGSTRKLMAATGMAASVAAAGGELHCFEEAGWDAFYEDMPQAGSHWKRGLMMPNILKAAQHIVLMPRCSRHMIAGSTLGLKAAVGYWRHDTRLEYHHAAATLQEKTAEGNTVPTLLAKQRLVVTAADKLLVTVGPDMGHIYVPDPGLIFASESVVAHDMVSLAWLLYNRQEMPDLRWEVMADRSAVVPRVANRVVTGWLGGWGKALTAERATKDRLDTIWDDRTLNRSYDLFGGVPDVSLASSKGDIAAGLIARLAGMTAAPD